MPPGIKGLFKDNTFPQHIADEMNALQKFIFEGIDAEGEQWEQHLTERQKEGVSVALARYYHCELCIRHHEKLLFKTFDEENLDKNKSTKNMKSIIFFLRPDMEKMNDKERADWGERWDKFVRKIEVRCDPLAPHLIGLAIGMARDDDFIIKYCGNAVKKRCGKNHKRFKAIVGELYAVVVYMKAATSKNRITKKIAALVT